MKAIKPEEIKEGRNFKAYIFKDFVVKELIRPGKIKEKDLAWVKEQGKIQNGLSKVVPEVLPCMVIKHLIITHRARGVLMKDCPPEHRGQAIKMVERAIKKIRAQGYRLRDYRPGLGLEVNAFYCHKTGTVQLIDFTTIEKREAADDTHNQAPLAR